VDRTQRAAARHDGVHGLQPAAPARHEHRGEHGAPAALDVAGPLSAGDALGRLRSLFRLRWLLREPIGEKRFDLILLVGRETPMVLRVHAQSIDDPRCQSDPRLLQPASERNDLVERCRRHVRVYGLGGPAIRRLVPKVPDDMSREGCKDHVHDVLAQ
jgi:hypothetical protein